MSAGPRMCWLRSDNKYKQLDPDLVGNQEKAGYCRVGLSKEREGTNERFIEAGRLPMSNREVGGGGGGDIFCA